jgi:hypothetical protein
MLEKNDWAAAGVQTAARTPAAHDGAGEEARKHRKTSYD